MKMQELKNEFEYKGKNYSMVFNINVMEQIQEEYGTVDRWGELTDGTATDANGQKIEPNAKAIKFGFAAMLNEGIEIENFDNGTNRPLLTLKEVGRMLTDIGLSRVTKDINELVINSTKDESAKNE